MSIEELPWNPAVRIRRTGYITWSRQTAEECVPLLQLVRDSAADLGVPLAYDLRYDGAPGELIYTECMGSLGGVIVTPADLSESRRRYQLADAAAKDAELADFGQLLDRAADKYTLRRYEAELPAKVVFLPGSNLLEVEAVDLDKLRAAVAAGAWVKPHPMTNRKFRNILQRSWPDRLIPRMYSGMACLSNATEIWTTGASELGLYGLLSGKRMHDIGSGLPAGGYFDLWSYLHTAPQLAATRLRRLLNCPERSGIFIPNPFFDVRERLRDYLAWHKSSAAARAH